MLPKIQDFKVKVSHLYDDRESKNLYYRILEEILHCDTTALLLHGDELMTDDKLSEYQQIVEKLSSGTPIQHIFGYTIFHNNQFYVNSDVLIPRPETEELINWILETSTNYQSILDIGTGSGCIAISLKKELSNTSISAIDISEKALEIAKKNAQCNQTEIQFFLDDILNSKSGYPQFSCIVSNPPYIRLSEKKDMHANVLEHDPHLSLFVADDDPLIFYRKIAEFGQSHLEGNGYLFFEINEYLANETMQLLSDNQYVEIELKQDINGKNRMIKCRKSNVK